MLPPCGRSNAERWPRLAPAPFSDAGLLWAPSRGRRRLAPRLRLPCFARISASHPRPLCSGRCASRRVASRFADEVRKDRPRRAVGHITEAGTEVRRIRGLRAGPGQGRQARPPARGAPKAIQRDQPGGREPAKPDDDGTGAAAGLAQAVKRRELGPPPAPLPREPRLVVTHAKTPLGGMQPMFSVGAVSRQSLRTLF